MPQIYTLCASMTAYCHLNEATIDFHTRWKVQMMGT